MNSGVTVGIPAQDAVYKANNYFLFNAGRPAALMLTAPAGVAAMDILFTIGNGNAAMLNVSFAGSTTQYVPIQGVLKRLFYRMQGSGSAYRGWNLGDVTFTDYNYSGVVISTATYTTRVIDCAARSMRYPESLSGNYPDTIKLLYMQSAYTASREVIRTTGDVEAIRIFDSNGIYMASGGDSEKLGLPWLMRIPYATPSPAAVMSLHDANDKLLKSIRIEYIDCDSESVLLMWWSSIDCGWKSRVAEVRRQAAQQVDAREYSRMFDNIRGQMTRGGLSCRFGCLSVNDAAYYYDIVISDEVYIFGTWDNGSTGSSGLMRVRVDGNPPQFRTSGATDIDFDLFTFETDDR